MMPFLIQELGQGRNKEPLASLRDINAMKIQPIYQLLIVCWLRYISMGYPTVCLTCCSSTSSQIQVPHTQQQKGTSTVHF
jgi:hypothetical protein